MDKLVICPVEFGTINYYFSHGRQHALQDIVLLDRIVDMLHAVAADLRAYGKGLRLWILDGVRTYALQDRLFHEAAHALMARGLTMNDAYSMAAMYVTPPNNFMPAPHVCGGAVDLVLGDQTAPFSFYAEYDSFDERQASAYYWLHPPSSVEQQREHHARELLNRLMTKRGFVRHPHEHCHFEYGTSMWAHHTNKAAIYKDFIAISRQL